MKQTQYTQIALSLSSGIFLLGFSTANFLLNQVLQIGELSEELFRGERLPILTPIPKENEVI